MQDEKFIRDRITELRLKKDVSEYRMSLDMGHSKGYIGSITSGRALPSMGEFLYMCEYFGITPREFFDEENKEPAQVNELCALAKQMNADDLQALIDMAKRIQK